jgi:hypothetical protein
MAEQAANAIAIVTFVGWLMGVPFGHTRAVLWMAGVVAAIAAVAGLIVVSLSVRDNRVSPAMLFVILAIVLSTIVASLSIYRLGNGGTLRASSASPSLASSPRSDSGSASPSPSQSPQPLRLRTPVDKVPHCQDIEGDGDYPDELDLWVVEKTNDGDFYPLKTGRKTGPGTWQIDKVSIGGSDTPDGAAIQQYLILLDKDTSRYVSSLLERQFRYAGMLPPNAQDVLPITWIRRADKTGC